MTYAQPVLDPWFLANFEIVEQGSSIYTVDSASSGDLVVYGSDFNMSALGCADQARICHAISGTCTEYGGISQVTEGLSGLGLNNVQLATAKTLLEGDWSTYFITFGMGNEGLSYPI
jgi:hypothetical protein